MADDDRSPRDRLKEELDLLAKVGAQPHAFDFFQALRRLEAIRDDLPRLGESTSPAQDPIRLGQQPAMAFPSRSIAGVTRSDPSRPPRLDTFFFGLFGANGPLPLHLTDYAFSRLNNHGDPTFARFADMFHHRLASLLYRAWAESEPTVSHDRPEFDRFAVQLAALAGLGLSSLRHRDAMPDLAKLHFTGRLASHTRNPDGLRAILSSFFTAPVEIQEFVPKWVHLPPHALSMIGRSRTTSTLGTTLTAGARIKVYHHRFRVVLGPLLFEQFERLLPGQPGLVRFVAIIRNYVGDELDWELQLVLRADQVPAVRLGQSGRLGWTGWIGKRSPSHHARDLTLQTTSIRTVKTAADSDERPPALDA